MNPNKLNFLVCPKTKRSLELDDSFITENGKIREGLLIEPTSGNQYPIINFIPRFVPQENYAANFGLQWNKHDITQYDEYSKFDISGERFAKATKWNSDLGSEIILEAGCGSGRFTKQALATGAFVVSFDYSKAVEANYRLNGNHQNLLLVQADIYNMPFRQEFFDKTFCFGVLQHTPDPKKAFFALVQHLKPSGHLSTDMYLKSIRRYLLQTKYWVRPFTRGKEPEKLYKALKKYVDFMWPLARVISKIPRIGAQINWRLLVADYSRILPNADEATLKEWAYLDTFDMLSPMYDYPQTLKTFSTWHQEAGLIDIDVHYGFNGIEGRGTKPK